MTIDEEIEHLAESLRRLKIEYDAYLNGGARRPPHLLASRVERLIKKYGAGDIELTFRQRYQFSQLAQSYFANKNLWRRKLQARDEGTAAERPRRDTAPPPAPDRPFSVTLSDPDLEPEKLAQLLDAVMRARAGAGESADFDRSHFAQFMREKTRQYKQSLECDRIRFTVALEGGRVKLRAERGVSREKS